jgi:hypothetical protein
MKRCPKTSESTVFSDKPCPKGHVGLRYKLAGRCVFCARERVGRHYKVDPQRIKRRSAEHRQLAESKRRRKEWYRANAQQVIAKTAEWTRSHPDAKRASVRKYQKKNADRYRVWNAKRSERIRRATPAWADQAEISKFYKLAQALNKETGILHSVDHIIPLQGRYICGLHVEENLQVIPLIDNARKSNVFDVLAA